ncbi:MAG: aspartate aminotransferase family protein [Chromatiaceae bacterium]|nr:MAG: aspartate aminotransferase family protein [Chromatiaceae bacterium]
MATYTRLPVAFVRGEGAWLWDESGRRYLDGLAGIAVCGLGHAHPVLQQALCEQAGALIHTSNLYRVPLQEELGARLCAAAGMDRVFFANSGAEANEAALKLARLHAHRQGIADPAVVVMDNAFHGRTLATLSATGNRKAQAGFEPLVQGFVRVPYGDIDALTIAATNRQNIVAVLVEPIQGEGGIVIPPPDYLARLQACCDQHGWLLMLDEIQTGMGRTGELFAHRHAGIQPDVMTLAKGLANGVPIGACLARGAAAEVLGPGSHGSTFGGNALACRAALSVLETLITAQLPARAGQLGASMVAGLRQALAGLAGVVEVRGAGLMLGIELDRPCAEIVTMALDEGLLINVTAQRVVRLLPPLIIDDDQATQLVDGVATVIRRFLGADRAADRAHRNGGHG